MKPYSRFSNARRCEIDGITFASQAEGSLYLDLKTKHRKIFCQPKVYMTLAEILYKPDFFTEDGVYHEMKGRASAVWGIKRRLWKHYGPSVLNVYKMKGSQPYFFEAITPVREGGD